jgi:predicted 3-demethylubiquinone-9 3-methyltransferase (glyoxalase superfamily)
MSVSKITPCLWFNDEAESAAKHYTSIFPNSKITLTQPQRQDTTTPAAPPMLVSFSLNGQPFVALNGGSTAGAGSGNATGPDFSFNNAVSFQIDCADQAEVDHYWTALGAGGDESKQHCGWLADRFGVRWQIIPAALKEVLGGPDAEGRTRAMQAMLKMKKLDVAELRRAYEG